MEVEISSFKILATPDPQITHAMMKRACLASLDWSL